MKKFLLLFFSVFSLSLAVPTISFADHHESHVTTDVVEQHNHKDKESHNHTTTEEQKLFNQEKSQEDDFEIPAFLRRQKF